MSKSDNKDLIKFLEAFPPESREIALWLRDFVWDLYPKCNELIYDNYNFLAFGWGPTERMSDIFCSIAVGTRGVIFGFMWGVKLEDPDGLLQGGGNQFRSLRVPDIRTFPTTAVKKLLKQAFENSVATLKGRPQTPNGETIVNRSLRKNGAPACQNEHQPSAAKSIRCRILYLLLWKKRTFSMNTTRARRTSKMIMLAGYRVLNVTKPAKKDWGKC